MKGVSGAWFPGRFVTRSLCPLSRGPGFQDHSFGAISMGAPILIQCHSQALYIF